MKQDKLISVALYRLISVVLCLLLLSSSTRFVLDVYHAIRERTTTDRCVAATVFEIAADETVFEDVSGNLWSVTDHGFSVGDPVFLVLNDNGTQTTEDDTILQVYPGN